METITNKFWKKRETFHGHINRMNEKTHEEVIKYLLLIKNVFNLVKPREMKTDWMKETKSILP